MLRRVVAAASAAALVPDVAPQSEGSFAYRVPAQLHAPRYRTLPPGPNLGATFAPDAPATEVHS